MSDDLTPRQKAGHFASLARQQRERFYIQFNTANSFIPNHKGPRAPYVRCVWPVLFKTRVLAETAMKVLPIFANANNLNLGRGRIKSASIERVLIDERRMA